MLAALRKTTDSFFMKIILVLLVASFALWGVGDVVGTQEPPAVASVGEEKVGAQEYYNALMQLRTNIGEYFSAELATSLHLYDRTLSSLISQKLLLQEARSLALNAGEVLLKEMMVRDPEFQDENGTFDRNRFNRRLRQLGMNEAQYLDSLRYKAKEYILEHTVRPPGLVPPVVIDTLYTIENEERQLLTFTISSLPEDKPLPEPTEEELRQYYKAHKEHYMAPEYRVLRYVLLDKEAVAQSIDVSSEQLRKRYEEQRDVLATPEKRKVLQLLYNDKAKAERAYALFRDGVSPQEVASQVPPENKGDLTLGMMTKAQLPTAANRIFALEEGGFTPPVQSDSGWHLFYVADIRATQAPSFEETKSKLRERLVNEQMNQKLLRMVEQMEDARAAGLSVAEIAETVHLDMRETLPISAKGRQSDHTDIADSARLTPVIEHGFSLKQNQTSEVKQMSDGSYYLVKPVNVIPKRHKAFEEVRGKVASDWREQQRRRVLHRYANNITEELRAELVSRREEAANGKSSLSAETGKQLLQEKGINVTGTIRLTRSGVTDGDASTLDPQAIDERFIMEVFNAREAPSVIPPVSYREDGFISGIFLRRLPLNISPDNEAYQEVKRRVSQQYRREVRQQYLNALRQRFPVTRHEEVIRQVVEQFN